MDIIFIDDFRIATLIGIYQAVPLNVWCEVHTDSERHNR